MTSAAVAKMTLRLRLAGAVSAAVGLIAVMAAVGALFPSVGHTIGTLNIPKSVSNLLGGGDYGTITGWFRSEIASIYGPLVIGALAITGASATTAGEEAPGWASPKTRQRSMVSRSIEKPRKPSSAGEAAMRPAASAMRTPAAAARRRTLSMDAG